VRLSAAERALIETARTAILATTAADGRPRLVPICFAVRGDVVWSPLDEKPKVVSDVRALARVRDIAARPDVRLLVDRWSEDWSKLAWLRIDGRATLVEPELVAVGVVVDLRAKYPQYLEHDLEHRPMLRIEIEAATGWSARPVDG
jgi:PPOX class probable F420-dependent enzyme